MSCNINFRESTTFLGKIKSNEKAKVKEKRRKKSSEEEKKNSNSSTSSKGNLNDGFVLV